MVNPLLLPANEAERLLALRGYRIVGTAREKLFDQVALITARLFQTPLALVSLVEEKEVWFKAAQGLTDVDRLPRQNSLCSAAILNDHLTIFEDLQRHPCELVNSEVAEQLNLRFYAAQSLTTSDGHNIGALCIIDHTPRTLPAPERAVLAQLAQLVTLLIELRASAIEAGMAPAYWRTVEQVTTQPLRQLLIVTNRLRRTESRIAREQLWQTVLGIIAETSQKLS
ncbi:GAF domain-containing protein [Hymenobacter koreensis]|uniref:GAF domain-containing protein n=1 Tax=Hymenobacter koreensis TaxID=1084523 RepID=A0ABP8IZ49_9BACT